MKKVSIKKIIIFFIMFCVFFCVYNFGFKNVNILSDAKPEVTKVKRIYDNGENSVIVALHDIETTSVTGAEVIIPKYTLIKAYIYENDVRKENKYSFNFRGLEFEFKDNLNTPAFKLFEGAYVYYLLSPQFLYKEPSADSLRSIIETDTTIIVEFDMGNNWLYCCTGDGKTGWLNTEVLDTDAEGRTIYKNTVFTEEKTNIKPSLIFSNITQYLNQFNGVRGITITSVSNDISPIY